MAEQILEEEPLAVPTFLTGKQPGKNVDLVSREAGVAEAAKFLGPLTGEQQMEIDYAIWRWGHGEEDAALKALMRHMDFVGAYRVIAAARAATQPQPLAPPLLECGPQPCPACKGDGEIQVGTERDTNAAITRLCLTCGGSGEDLP